MVEPLTDRHAPLPAQVLQQAAATFGMLAATARLQIVWLLAKGERDVGTLAAEHAIPLFETTSDSLGLEDIFLQLTEKVPSTNATQSIPSSAGPGQGGGAR